MGSFSWLRADVTSERNNIVPGEKFKMLIPEVFGGGYIIDKYQDYGSIRYNDTILDMYGILAYFNANMPYKNGCVIHYLQWDGKDAGVPMPHTMDEIAAHGKTGLQENRCIGIDIGTYANDIARLKYPLKLVTFDYPESYENCKFRSFTDPKQGFERTKWDERLSDTPIYPLSGEKREVREYWRKIFMNEMVKARQEYVKQNIKKQQEKEEMISALEKLKNAWETCNTVFSDTSLDINDYISEKYPFDVSFDEIRVLEWIDHSLAILKS